jgi:hypothetical protein
VRPILIRGGTETAEILLYGFPQDWVAAPPPCVIAEISTDHEKPRVSAV